MPGLEPLEELRLGTGGLPLEEEVPPVDLDGWVLGVPLPRLEEVDDRVVDQADVGLAVVDAAEK